MPGPAAATGNPAGSHRAQTGYLQLGWLAGPVNDAHWAGCVMQHRLGDRAEGHAL